MLTCKYAWAHLDFKKGHYAPCFRFDVSKTPMPKNSEMLPSEAINSEQFKLVRQQLQQGKFPAGCYDCQYKEENHLKSHRIESTLPNKKFGNVDVDYENLEIKKLAELELKFSRKCNFLCRHCDSQSNDSFELLGRKHSDIKNSLENLKFNHISNAKNPITEISDENIEDIITNLVPITNRIFFSGGEPLFHETHYKFLIRLIKDPSINTKTISLGYNTNLSIIKFKQHDIFELWSHFENIEMTLSLDGTGELFNYFREKGDYAQVIENIKTVVSKASNFNALMIVCTCSSYHAFYAEETFKDITNLINDLKKINPKVTYRAKPTFVLYPKSLDMVNLEQDLKLNISNKLKKSLEESKDLVYNEAIDEIIKKLEAIPTDDTSGFVEVVKLQDKLYKRNCKESCPRIYEYVYNGKII